ncbi:hypothetical protein [Helicobacter pylori]|uniref:hypothetical protein n=1 Tax=Helicobacter pylori TaxID=210 RepID=UPI00165CC4A2|nr:hypothetical protein [Helicobacter pylori]
MSSDFKNLFIGAKNNKRTKFDLLDKQKKPLSIPIRYHLSLMLISRNIREAKKQLSLKISVKILTNLYWLN